MKKKITNLIILDASSSMHYKAPEVRDGLKDLMKDIKKDMKETKDARFKTIICQFSGPGKFKVLLNTSNRKEIKMKIADTYHPAGWTALYDAIGEGFGLIDDNEDGVFVNILTDGEENSSQEFTQKAIKQMLADAEKNKWGVTFMGTTKDAINKAVELGIEIGNTYQFTDDAQGVEFSNNAKFLSRKLYTNTVLTASSMDGIKTRGLIADIADEIEDEVKK